MTPANRLVHESSPYLLQHAHNPVEWYPWGEEALAAARKQGKLILVSIGYSACHWCHVMERESFTDPRVAALLAADFISIKVDREERPEVDAHFMELLLAMHGQGGWPLNLFLTPDLQPLFGGTYFPPTPRHGLPAFTQVLEILGLRWRDEREALLREQRELVSQLQRLLRSPAPTPDPGVDPEALALAFWRQRLDHQEGGLGRQPKFPQPLVLSFLLRHAREGGAEELSGFLLGTLDRMAAGGIRDQLGGAFHRYAVDRQWLVPHFEIMLYDNALLARLYLEAHRAWGLPRHARVARGILEAMLERFRLADGGYLSALDADSPDPAGRGVEGYCYTWTREEVEGVLGREGAIPFLAHYAEPGRGEVEGRFTLRLVAGGDSLVETEARLARERALLLEHRKRRPPPARDDKVLTSWNGLLLSALALGARNLGESRYLTAARELAHDLLDHPRAVGRLGHSRLGDRLGEGVFLEDYACVLQGLLDLHQADPEPAWLERAEGLAGEMVERFAGAADHPWPMTPRDQPGLLPPRVELEDGVTPSGNGCALVGLSRLALLTGAPEWEERATALGQGVTEWLATKAPAAVELLRARSFLPPRGSRVTVVGAREDPLTRELLETVRRHAGESTLLLWLPTGDPLPPRPWAVPFPLPEGRPAAHPCRGTACLPPISDPGLLARWLAGEEGNGG